ncbi:uncharacterized protein LOC125556231 [Triticum urartu]|uniref:uncharacterized protein LOC125556231 n=1 Tax=Triticum urartu TaxID=4572 RepID=UPI00204347F3|nr:uncharacterized protein LOC125556231 [Triticum urartu]
MPLYSNTSMGKLKNNEEISTIGFLCVVTNQRFVLALYTTTPPVRRVRWRRVLAPAVMSRWKPGKMLRAMPEGPRCRCGHAAWSSRSKRRPLAEMCPRRALACRRQYRLCASSWRPESVAGAPRENEPAAPWPSGENRVGRWSLVPSGCEPRRRRAACCALRREGLGTTRYGRWPLSPRRSRGPQPPPPWFGCLRTPPEAALVGAGVRMPPSEHFTSRQAGRHGLEAASEPRAASALDTASAPGFAVVGEGDAGREDATALLHSEAVGMEGVISHRRSASLAAPHRCASLRPAPLFARDACMRMPVFASSAVPLGAAPERVRPAGCFLRALA